MKQLANLFVFGCILVYPVTGTGYEVVNHADMSEAAAKASVLGEANSDALLDLGLERSIEDPKQAFPNTDGDPKTLAELIRDGARFEDNTVLEFEGVSTTRPRVRHHFFDPIRNRALTFGIEFGHTSPDWALEEDNLSDQAFSYAEAKEYLTNALTDSDEDERAKNFGLTFQTLGHVIHHIQDMAQPQHVRNDWHTDIPGVENLPGEQPSRFEEYTELVRDGLKPLFTGYGPVRFDEARKYWITNEEDGPDRGTGQGLAEFTNNNFVSDDTNFQLQGNQIAPSARYALPVPAGVPEVVSIESLLSNAERCHTDASGQQQCLTGDLEFFPTIVNDRFSGPPQLNPRASTLSLFDADLQNFNVRVIYEPDELFPGEPAIVVDRLFTLNKFNFDVSYQFLIPRAVAYSTGLIDYFFRGRLEAVDPVFTDTGISFKVRNAIDTEKFPEWDNEVLEGNTGEFLLTVKYKQADKEHLDVSSPVAFARAQRLIPGDSSTDTSTETLSFTLPPLPDGATDVEHRLIWRGDLGEEDQAIAVGIVEPVSGFLVRPSYRPDDGISGKRLIVKNGRKWRLAEDQGLQAGNIDWKGWYVRGRSTKVLSWRGPASRYFPASRGTPFSRNIYQGGELFAVAPCLVLGAAITKETDAKEWLVAICRNGLSDIVYRRPNTPSDSPVLFDPVTNPEGWEEIGNFPPQKDALAPDRPWFFNASGTEAQTMRPLSTRHTVRLKISMNGASASLVNLGNTKVTSNTRRETHYANCEWFSGDNNLPVVRESRTSSSRGSSVVAVDYKGNTEVLASIQVNNSQNFDLNGRVLNGDNNVAQDSTSLTNESRVLHFGGTSVTLRQHVARSTRHLLAASSGQEFTEESVSTVNESTSILFLDLREALVVTRTRQTPSSSSASWPDFDLTPGRFTSSSSDRLKYALAYKGGNTAIYDDTQTQSSSGERRFPSYLFEPLIFCFGSRATNTDDVQTSSNEHTASIGSVDVDGNFAIDSVGHALVSMNFRDRSNNRQSFSFLTNGRLDALIPPGSTSAVYYPLGVLK